jgi:hypothetical protein
MIELKKLKVHEDVSEETLCYSAVIVVDGVAAIRATNSGLGADDSYYPLFATKQGREDYDVAMAKIETYVKTMPMKVCSLFPEGLAYDMDLLVGDLIEAEEQKKDFKRFVKSLSTKVFLLDGGKLYSIKGVFTASLHAKLNAKYPGSTTLNSLSADVAWELAKPFVIGVQ